MHVVGRLLIHCSGGVGRSATFTAVLGVLRLAEARDWAGLVGQDGALDLEPSVRQLRYSSLHWRLEYVTIKFVLCRQCRHPWAVEGEQQYRLAYTASLSLLSQELFNLQATSSE